MKKWVAGLKRCRDSTEDDPRSNRPKTSTTDEQVDVIHRMVLNDRRRTVKRVANPKNFSSGSVDTGFNLILGMSKLSATWVSRMLTTLMPYICERVG